MDKSIQIVCFDNPYPPNYGGAIDVFYKIKALFTNGIDVYLHFYYDDHSERKDDRYIKKFCKEVFLYKRQNAFTTHISLKPFIVKSRESKDLTQNLIKIGFPVLYEGLNTTSSLVKVGLNDIKTFVRLHNIEHNYYGNLGGLEDSWSKKMYYRLEAFRLKYYQSVLKNADLLFAISKNDQNYFSSLFSNVKYLPVFQSKQELLEVESQEYCLFHGDLRLSDNIRSAEFLINFFSNHSNKNLVIASSFENKKLKKCIQDIENISFQRIESLEDLENAFKRTALHILMSYQSSGIKLKLLNALHTNSYVLANDKIVEGTGLESSCEVFNNHEELGQNMNKFFGKKISDSRRQQRLEVLKPFRSNHAIKILLEYI